MENPVLQRELLVNLRTFRAFLLLLAYQVLLAAIVYFAWPQVERLDLSQDQESARRLFDLLFLGQFVLASLMVPSFAAGTLTGEKERKTYEMLLASPLRPGAIVIGKLFAALAHLALLIFTSLPIVMLCLPLGGVSLYEVLAGYLILMLSVATFGMITVACSGFFQRSASSLVVSYLLILPIALSGAMFWQIMEDYASIRLWILLVIVPVASLVTISLLFFVTAERLLYPRDLGSEGKEVVDLDQEAEQAIGLVIQRDQFPDRLFAPPKRTQLLEDHANPVYEKELHSEIFAQGTLMLRVVIQVSMILAIIPMGFYLYWFPHLAPLYIAYVLIFNIMVGPVFSAGSITSERERETLDLLLTTEISPWQILSAKLMAGFRVSAVLTAFLLWPVLLACVMVMHYWYNIPSVLAYLLVVAITCVTTSMLGLFCSVMFRKTVHSQICTYGVIIVLFGGTLALQYFAELAAAPPEQIVPTEGEASPGELATGNLQEDQDLIATPLMQFSRNLTMISPFAAIWDIPVESQQDDRLTREGDWPRFFGYVAVSAALNIILFGLMVWLFHARWRVAD